MISFKPLGKTLVDRGYDWTDLYKHNVVSRGVVYKLKKNALKGSNTNDIGKVNLDTLEKLCKFLKCKVTDIIEIDYEE